MARAGSMAPDYHRLPLPLPEPPPRAAPFLRRLQLVDQLGVAFLLQLKPPLEEGYVFLQEAYPLLGHGQLRLRSFDGAWQGVVQHHVNPMPPSMWLSFRANLSRGDPPVQGGQGYRQFPARLGLGQNPRGRPPFDMRDFHCCFTCHRVSLLTRHIRQSPGGSC